MFNKSMKITLALTAIALFSAACRVNVSQGDATNAPDKPAFATPTLAPSETPRPTFTPAPPTITPTVNPVEGTTTTQINVRSAPDKNANALGMLNAGEVVQIVGKDTSGKWWMIVYPKGTSSLGWVTSEFVRASGSTSGIRVTGGSTPTALPTGGPTATPTVGVTPPPGVAGTTTQKLNVRSGPGTAYNVLGIINAGVDITLTGKNETGTWLQVFFPEGPGERGWVTAAYVSAGDVSSLLVFNDEGTPVAVPDINGTPQPTPTVMIAPAPDDGDSATAPATSVNFSPGTSRLFTYTSDVSYPEGDREDWIEFAPFSAVNGQIAPIVVRIECQGNSDVKVQLWRNNSALKNLDGLYCGANLRLELETGYTYQLRIQPAEGSGGLLYVLYTLTAKVEQ